MKHFFLLIAAAIFTLTANAQHINYHLTGCTADEENPTEYTNDDNFVELYFTPEDGYTLQGWEVTVKHGETIIPVNDYESTIGYVYPDASYNYVFIIWYDEITEDFDVTIVCKEDTGMPFELPEIFSAASFEEAEFSMEENSVYRPETFVTDANNWFLSGAVAAYTSVTDWGDYGIGYSATQIVNYSKDAVIADYSDAYLPMAADEVAEGENYATTNIMGAFETLSLTPTILSGIAVTNTQTVVDAIINGDYMSTEEAGTGLPFHEGDYFKLTITGLFEGIVTKSIDFYLADFRFTDNGTYAENWQWVDLTELGTVDQLQFALEGTKKNNYGLTTPTYFCWDNLGGDPEDCNLGEMSVITPVALDNATIVPATKVIRNGQLIITRDGVHYNVMGQAL